MQKAENLYKSFHDFPDRNHSLSIRAYVCITFENIFNLGKYVLKSCVAFYQLNV